MRRRSAGKLSREPVVPIKLEIVTVETHALVLFFQPGDKGCDSIKFVSSHLNVFGLPGSAHDVVDGFGMKKKASLLAIHSECLQVIEILEVYGGVDLNCVMTKITFDVIEGAENGRQAVDT